MEYKNKNVLVCGIARSGISAARLLAAHGASVTLQDIKEAGKLEYEISQLQDTCVTLYLGKNPDEELLDSSDLLIISPGIPTDLPFVVMAREKGLPVISEIELAYSMCKAPVIGITGTNGKTTTTTLTGEIYKVFNPGTQVVGNIGVPFTERVGELSENDFVICELSSFQLETIDIFRPVISAVINITPDHLDWHKSLENYIAAKENIFKNQMDGDFIILNYDDAVCRTMAEKCLSRVVFFSQKQELEHGVFLRGSEIITKQGGKEEVLIHRKELQTTGTHLMEDIMAAAAIALCSEIPLDIIRGVLRSFRGVEHRFEYVSTINGVDFINDSKATNPDAAIKALEAMDKQVVLIGGGYDKNSDFSDWVKLFDGKVKHLIVLGDVADKIIEVCKAYGFAGYDKVNSLKDAVELGFSKASPGDCVLLSPACASWGMFDNYEQRGNMFKDFVIGLST